MLTEIYYTLKNTFEENKTMENIKKMQKIYPELFKSFQEWLSNYWNLERNSNNKNDIIFDVNSEKDYCKAIIYYISGMTDNYAISTYNKIIEF